MSTTSIFDLFLAKKRTTIGENGHMARSTVSCRFSGGYTARCVSRSPPSNPRKNTQIASFVLAKIFPEKIRPFRGVSCSEHCIWVKTACFFSNYAYFLAIFWSKCEGFTIYHILAKTSNTARKLCPPPSRCPSKSCCFAKFGAQTIFSRKNQTISRRFLAHTAKTSEKWQVFPLLTTISHGPGHMGSST